GEVRRRHREVDDQRDSDHEHGRLALAEEGQARGFEDVAARGRGARRLARTVRPVIYGFAHFAHPSSTSVIRGPGQRRGGPGGIRQATQIQSYTLPRAPS